MDDRRARGHPLRDAPTGGRADARLPALDQPAGGGEAQRPSLPRDPCRDHPGGDPAEWRDGQGDRRAAGGRRDRPGRGRVRDQYRAPVPGRPAPTGHGPEGTGDPGPPGPGLPLRRRPDLGRAGPGGAADGRPWGWRCHRTEGRSRRGPRPWSWRRDPWESPSPTMGPSS